MVSTGNTMLTGLAVLLIVVWKSAIGALLDHPMAAKSICPHQCFCSAAEMLCPGANITDVLNHGIDNQILHLDLSNTSLDAIPMEVSYMTFCTKLNLSANRIRTVDEYTFLNLWNVEELALNDNAIADVAALSLNVLFYNNRNIKVLNVSGNPLADLQGRDRNAVLYSESLEVLDASRCRVASLTGSRALAGLKRLTYLNLSDNPLAQLDGLYSATLKLLNVRGCLLGHVGEGALVGLPNLEVFDAGLNDQLHADGAVLSPKLRTLDVSLCSVRVPDLSAMTDLRSAFLNGNRIKRIGAYQFANNSKLVTLDLSSNHVETVDPLAFHGMTALVYLDLSSNKIADMPWEATAAAMPNLETLDLSHNHVARVGPMRSAKLRRLDLSHCWIQWVPNATFARLAALAELSLSNNPLHTLLPGSLDSSSLSRLDLAYCRISHLAPHEFARSPELAELRLTGNRLVTLKNGTFRRCPKLSRVYLDDNPWRCDCYGADFAYMAHLANVTGKQSPIDRNPRCLSPDNVTGVTWSVACANGPAYGRDNRKNFSMAVGVILILCVSGMMAICVAVHENVKTRQAMRRRRQLDGEYGGGGGGEAGGGGEYCDEYAAAAESLRKLSQLPSYDEAVMLPRPSAVGPPDPARLVKRHSCTQTDEAETTADGPRDGRLIAPPGFRVTRL